MKRVNKWLTKLKNTSLFIPRFFHKLSISTQVIITIILVFSSFFLLQTILNNQFFKNFYTDKEFENIQSDLTTYVQNLNKPDNDYYDIMCQFTQENNAYSVIVDGQYRILNSSSTTYYMTIKDQNTNNEYDVIVPENNHSYTVGSVLDLTIYNYNDKFYSAASISIGSTAIYDSEISCSETSCITFEGTVEEVNKPNNLNYLFSENLLVETEISKLANDNIDLRIYAYEFGDDETGYWYRSNDGPEDSLVFVHNLKTWNWVVTIIPIADTNDIISIIASYNYYVYATAIAIIIIWSFRISAIISKPTKNFELVAREIAHLNFDVEAKEFTNKENRSLSNSINLISKNLKDALKTLNKNNQELTTLYEEQSKQVNLKKQLVSSISHELKTPLVVMQVTIQGILDGIISQDNIDDELENVLDEINKSSLMIQDMLQIYRLDNAETELDITTFNLSKETKSFIDEFEHTFEQNNYQFDTNIQDEVFISADLNLIKRVISNYFTNVIKYTPNHEKIYLEVSNHQSYVYFEITNYGTTIEKEELERIWLPFYRVKQDSPSPKGSGIGLYLVSEILDAHNADFSIENVNNGVKSWFKLYKNKPL